MEYGLTEKEISRIKDVLSNYSSVREVRLFGSRAKDAHRQGSDIDLVLMGKNIRHKTMLKLKSNLNALNFPYTFDVVIYSTIDEPALKDHIDRVGLTFYKRSAAEASS